MPPTEDLARNPVWCPDWESNLQPFGLQASTQSSEPHQLGLILILYYFFLMGLVHFLMDAVSSESSEVLAVDRRTLNTSSGP